MHNLDVSQVCAAGTQEDDVLNKGCGNSSELDPVDPCVWHDRNQMLCDLFIQHHNVCFEPNPANTNALGKVMRCEMSSDL
jgi:hypothetical protein